MPTAMEEYINKQLEKEPETEMTELLLDNITSEKITGLEGREFPVLNHLSLIGCNLTSFEGLTSLPNLKVIDASENKISDLSPLAEKTPGLYHLNLCGNDINTIDQILPLAKLESLQVLDVFDCPIGEVEDYRAQIFATIPSLKYLDGFDVNNVELAELDDTGYEELDEAEDLEEEDDEEADEEEEDGVGLDYLNSSSALNDDDESADYVSDKKNGLKRKAADGDVDEVPAKKDALDQEN